MELNALLVAAFIAILVFMAYMGITAYIEKQKTSKDLRSRLQESTAFGLDRSHSVYQDSVVRSTDGGEAPNGFAEFCKNMLRMVGVNIEAAKEKIGPKFLTAGMRGEAPIVIYLFFQRFGAAALLFFAAIFLLQVDDVGKDLLSLLSGMLCLILGLFGPPLYLENAVQKQKQALTRSFPDTLDLILVCIESGLALDAALARVCQELGRSHPRMTAELDRMRLEFSMLDDRARALTNFSERTDLACTRSLVAALVQSEKFGTPLSEALRVLAEDYRASRLMDAEQKAGKIPAIITVPTIFMMLPALFIIILGPTIITTIQSGGLFGGVNNDTNQ